MVKNLPAAARDSGSISGLEKITGRRKWQPTPVLLPGEYHGSEEPGRLQSMGLQSQIVPSNLTHTHTHTHIHNGV